MTHFEISMKGFNCVFYDIAAPLEEEMTANGVIHKPGPGESLENSRNHLFSSAVRDPGCAENFPMAAGFNSAASSCDDVLQELNQAAFETIREVLEQDPLYEMFLDETIGIVEP